MLSNIIIGICAFLLGGIIGGAIVGYKTTNGIIRVAKMYEKETGNDFVSWMLDKSNDERKHRVDKFYAAE